MFSYVRTLFPPTSADHCVFGSFVSENESNVIVSRGNILSVYRIDGCKISYETQRVKDQANLTTSIFHPNDHSSMDDLDDELTQLFGGKQNESTIKDTPVSASPSLTAKSDPLFNSSIQTTQDATLSTDKCSLHLVGEYPLCGVIQGIALVRFENQPTDTLAIAFAKAKISMVQYDGLTNDLRTLPPLVTFEKSREESDGPSSFPAPILRISQSSGCLALSHSHHRLGVVPFRKHEIMEEMDADRSIIKDRSHKIDEPYEIDLLQLESPIGDITDFIFLDQNFDSNILILHQPNPSWAGRLSTGANTHEIRALALVHSHKIGRVWWGVEKLPYDAFRLVPAPKQLGGAIVLCTNSIIFVNPSGFYGLSLNDYAPFSPDNTRKYDRRTDLPPISLDDCRHAWLDDSRLLITLRNGESFIFYIISDVRSVKGIIPVKIDRLPVPSDICNIGKRHLFFASRFDDCHILSWDDTPLLEVASPSLKGPKRLSDSVSGGNDPQAKTNKLRRFGKHTFQSKIEERDENFPATCAEDDEEVALTIDPRVKQLILDVNPQGYLNMKRATMYSLLSINNHGPVGEITVGRPEPLPSDPGQQSLLDIGLCSGFDKSGSINILQRTVRSEVSLSFDMPLCYKIWAIGRKRKSRKRTQRSSGDQSLNRNLGTQSKSRKTKAPAPADDFDDEEQRFRMLEEDDEDDESQTSLSSDENEKRLFEQSDDDDGEDEDNDDDEDEDEDDEGDEDPLGAFSELPSADRKANTENNDRFLVISTTSHTVVFDCSEELAPLSQEGHFYTKGPTRAVSPLMGGKWILQVHHRGIRLLEQDFARCEIAVRDPRYNHGLTEPVEIETASICDPYVLVQLTNGHVLLYVVRPSLSEIELLPWAIQSQNVRLAKLQSLSDIKDPCFWKLYDGPSLDVVCTIYRSHGDFDIVSIPDGVSLYHSPDFGQCYELLEDTRDFLHHEDEFSLLDVRDISMATFNGSLPYIVVELNTFEVYIYTCTLKKDSASMPRLPFYFHKKSVDPYTFRYFPPQEKGLDIIRDTIYPFENISGKSGFFVTGIIPLWIFVEDGQVRVHPMRTDQLILSFTPFQNRYCRNGFIYSNQSSVRICQLPSSVSVDEYWPTRRIPVQNTVHRLTYLATAKAYAAIVSIPSLEAFAEIGQHVPPTYQNTFQLRLHSPLFWGDVSDKFDFEANERVEQMKVLVLKQGTQTARSFLVIGTGYCISEEVPTEGRILIFDIGVTRVDETRTRPWLKLISDPEKKYKGPVSAIGEINNYLVASIGPRVTLMQLTKDGELVGKNFYDASLFVTDLQTIRNFLFLGDVMKSTTLLLWRESDKRFERLAKDLYIHNIYCTQFLVDYSQLSFLASDSRGNMQIWTWKRDGRPPHNC
eukprot:TRINITY_DN2904_c0_g1_i5.p1 TRINITY_DN2904_c0_g1~~TRINITY_DN2904_c0_g1_i5.p1  ORF type:complete len:1381 (+),score=217.15 TRINITY_DN2904_c0_g1_i5:50-4192(+)